MMRIETNEQLSPDRIGGRSLEIEEDKLNERTKRLMKRLEKGEIDELLMKVLQCKLSLKKAIASKFKDK
jgi:hypothetical protein